MQLANEEWGDRGAHAIAVYIDSSHLGHGRRLCYHLATLCLTNCGIGPRGAQHLACALKGTRSLTQLSLANNPLTCSGVAAVCQALTEYEAYGGVLDPQNPEDVTVRQGWSEKRLQPSGHHRKKRARSLINRFKKTAQDLILLEKVFVRFHSSYRIARPPTALAGCRWVSYRRPFGFRIG
jgi:hypothetical protein